LEIKDITVSREIIAERTRTRIQWHAHGCHKISILGCQDQPGMIKGVVITELASPKFLNICFFGYNAVQEYCLKVPATDIQFFKQFSNTEAISLLATTSYTNEPAIFSINLGIPSIQLNTNISPFLFNIEMQSLSPDDNSQQSKLRNSL
jgi:hypothetical protein